MRPLLSYYGGKQRMAPKLLPLIPEHDTYVEVFCGGAALLFAKAPSKQEVINDIHGTLVHMYRVAVEQPELFYKRLESTAYSKDEYERALHVTKSAEYFTDIDRAVCCYIAHNWSFAKKFRGGWAFSPTQSQARGARAKQARVGEQLERLSGVSIENTDAIEVIKKWDRPGTFFYCDPPYIDTDQGAYEGYGKDDLSALCETLSTIKGKFLLSSYPNEVVPSNWPTRTFSARLSAARRTTVDTARTEQVWMNYEPRQMELL